MGRVRKFSSREGRLSTRQVQQWKLFIFSLIWYTSSCYILSVKMKLNFSFWKYFPFYFFLSLDLPISTRFYALSLARHVCPQIRVFGMELGNPCERFVKYLIIRKNILTEEPCQKFSCANGFYSIKGANEVFKVWEKLFIQSESVFTSHHKTLLSKT